MTEWWKCPNKVVRLNLFIKATRCGSEGSSGAKLTWMEGDTCDRPKFQSRLVTKISDSTKKENLGDSSLLLRQWVAHPAVQIGHYWLKLVSRTVRFKRPERQRRKTRSTFKDSATRCTDVADQTRYSPGLPHGDNFQQFVSDIRCSTNAPSTRCDFCRTTMVDFCRDK